MAFMGTIIATGSGKGVVVATGNDTELGKISQMLQTVSYLYGRLVFMST